VPRQTRHEPSSPLHLPVSQRPPLNNIGIGYCPIFTSTEQYWVLGDIFMDCHIQYRYSSDIMTSVVYQLPAENGRESGKKVKSWGGTHNNIVD